MQTLATVLGTAILALTGIAMALGLVAAIVHEWAWLWRGLAKLRRPDPYEAFWRDQERQATGDHRAS